MESRQGNKVKNKIGMNIFNKQEESPECEAVCGMLEQHATIKDVEYPEQQTKSGTKTNEPNFIFLEDYVTHVYKLNHCIFLTGKLL